MGTKSRQDDKRTAYGRAARRRKRSKKKYTLYYLLALVLMLCVGAALSLTVFFKIESIQVVGDTRYAKEELIDAAGISVGENLFRVSKKSTSEKLVAGYPYIAQIRLQRVLPNALLMHVTEAEVKAAIETGPTYTLLDGRGRVLEIGLPTCPENYFRVVGFTAEGLSPGDFLSEQDADKLSLLLEIQDCATANGLSKIKLADLSDPADIWLLYDGRVAIELGGRLDIDYKIRAAKSVIDLSVTDKTVGTLDVSTRPAMRLRERNIYDSAVWPFPAALISDYERAVPKNNRTAEAPSSAASAQGGEDTLSPLVQQTVPSG